MVLLQWVSQLLTVLAGIWALFGETTIRDARTGRKRLTPLGYAKVSLLLILFSVYVASDRENARKREADSAAREAQLRLQAAQLTFLQQLLLFEHQVSGVTIAWPLQEPDYARVEAALRAVPKPTLDAVDGQFREYLATAFRHGELRASTTADVRPRLTLMLGRPQGLYSRDYAGPSPEWELFQTGLRALTTTQFQLVRADGTALLDLIGRHWPCDAVIADGRVTFTIRSPGIRFPDLTDSPLYFEAADSAAASLPGQVRLQSLDPRFQLDTTFTLHWQRHVWRSVQIAEDETRGLATERSEALRLNAVLRLVPDTTQRVY